MKQENLQIQIMPVLLFSKLNKKTDVKMFVSSFLAGYKAWRNNTAADTRSVSNALKIMTNFSSPLRGNM